MPADPSRTGSVAFWRPDGEVPPAVASGAFDDLTVALPGDDDVELVTVPAVLLPVRAALPVLTRARAAAHAHRTTKFWGAGAVLALQLAARGLLLPGLTASDHDAWRAGPLRADDLERVRELAAAMPPDAHAVPVDGREPVRLPDPERLLRAFLDAVADALPRSPAASCGRGRCGLRGAGAAACAGATRLGRRRGRGARRGRTRLAARRGPWAGVGRGGRDAAPVPRGAAGAQRERPGPCRGRLRRLGRIGGLRPARADGRPARPAPCGPRLAPAHPVALGDGAGRRRTRRRGGHRTPRRGRPHAGVRRMSTCTGPRSWRAS